MANFFKCDDCGNVLLEMVAPTKECKGQDIVPLQADSVDAATEKHVPVVSEENGMVKVKVGSVAHPMLPEHYIQFIYVKTTFGGVYAELNPGDPPEALLNIKKDEVVEVYEYCNLHGLWKTANPQADLGVDFDQNTVACSPEFADGCVNPSGQ